MAQGAPTLRPTPSSLAFGPFEILPLSDGRTALPNAAFPALARAGGAPAEGDFALPIFAFLIRHAGGTLLVDSGSAGNFGPEAGRFRDSLVASGTRAEEVDAVFLTHLHSDHYGGLLAPEGGAAFPRARLILSAAEWDHVHDPARHALRPPEGRAGVERARRAVAPYAGRVRLAEDGEPLAPGLRVLALPGHTPGHSGLELEHDGRHLLIVGDLVHCPDYQLRNPGWSVIYDDDPARAAATRTAVLTRAARAGCRLVGAHLGPSGSLSVAAAGQGFRALDGAP